jgi:MtrB/PioB family decaheme-associated outer membrane protein
MKTHSAKLKARVLVLATQGALAAMCAIPAQAEEPAAPVAAPERFAEFGVLDVSKSSAKFGEYNGLDKSGAQLNGSFGIRGGNGYGDPNGTQRWEIRGEDLGLTSRSLGAGYSDQGRWSFNLNFDQLRHNTSDTYQTPYSGSVGGNSFTLPSFGTINKESPNLGTRALSAAQLSQFQLMPIHNDRDNYSAIGTLVLNPQWNLKVDFNRLEQSGAKLQGFGSAQLIGAPSAKGEGVSILPMPTNYRTDQVNLALNWLGEKAHATGSYYGSFFRDNFNGVNFQTWAVSPPGQAASVVETMGTAPSNDFHQFNLTGGYAFSKRTKLAGGLSYSRNTQNESYAYDTRSMIAPSPTSSLNGLVVNKHADVKVTDQTTKDLTLAAGLKYDNRDNRTASNIYHFFAIDGSNNGFYPNAPRSIKKTQLELAGDYRLNMKQKVRFTYNHDDTKRECSQYATGGGNPSATAVTTFPYLAGTDCLTVPNTKEDKLGAAWRFKAAEGVNLNAGYTFSNRKSDRDLSARPPMIGFDGNTIVNGSSAATSVPGISGLNGGEFIGFNPFYLASRKQNLLKAGVNWEPTDRWSVGVNGRYTNDKYSTDFGAQKGHQLSLNLDTTFAYREDGTISAYVTQQERTRDVTNEAKAATSNAIVAANNTLPIPSGATWNNNLKDTDTTLGLALKQGGLMGGKLDLLGDLSYSWTKTSFVTTFNYVPLTTSTTTGGAGSALVSCDNTAFFTCGALPDITSRLLQLRLSGTYAVAKATKVRLGWTYQKLSSNDFYYNGLQTGATPTSVLPTNQVAPNYTVNVLYASFIHNF